MGSGNPNPPENLAIHPLVFPDRRAKPFSDDDSFFSVFGYPAQRDAIQKYGIAGRVWEAAYSLNRYVHPPLNIEFDPPFIQEPSRPLIVLELGSGAGMTSACLANVLDPRKDILIATDLPEVCPLLEHNLSACFPSGCSSPLKTFMFVRPMAWGDEAHSNSIASEFLSRPQAPRSLSHVICSDLIYFPELLAPLLRTLLQISSPPFSQPPSPDNRGVIVIISYQLRSLSKETPFWSTFGLWFDFKPVLVRDGTTGCSWQRFGTSTDDTTFIFIASRRMESFCWKVPTNDRDLLAGKGAKGDDSAKADDTFETLLFMTLGNLET